MIFLLLILATGETDEFKYARGLYEDKLYDMATGAFSNFLNRYPDSKFAPNSSIMMLSSMNKEEDFEEVCNRARTLLSRYPSVQTDILIEWGKAEMNLGDYEEATTLFKKAGGKESFMWVGEVEFKRKNYSKAIENYLSSEMPYGRLSAGWCYLKLKEYKKALSLFSKINGNYKEEGTFFYAKTLHMMNDENAESSLNNYLSTNPEGRYTGRVFIMLSEIYEKKGNIDKSIKYLNKAIESQPEISSYAIYRMGLIYYDNENYETSIKSFSRIPKDDVYYVDALYWKALAEIETGRINDALLNLEKIAGTESNLKNESLFELGKLYSKLNKTEEAIKRLNKVDKELRDEALILMGNIMLRETDYDRAFKFYRLAMETGKNNASLGLLQMAITVKKKGEKDRALELLKKYTNKFPEGKEINKVKLLSGDILLDKKEYRKAIIKYEEVENSGDSSLLPYALEGKAWAYVGLEKYDLAFATLDLLSNQYPEFCSKPEIFLQLGDAAYAINEIERAEKAYNQVSGNFKPEALFKLGKMYFELEQYSKAIETFLKIRKRFAISDFSNLASYYLALCMRKKQNIAASNQYLRRIIKEIHDRKIKIKSLLLLADNHFDRADYDSSYKYYGRSFDLIRGKKDEKSFIEEELSAIRGILLSVNLKSGSKRMEKEARSILQRVRGLKLASHINLITGEILFNSGNFKSALDYLEESDSPEAYYNIGMAYLKLNKTEEAMLFFRKATSGEDIKNDAYLQLGNIYYKKGNYSKAIDNFSKSKAKKAELMEALSLYKTGSKERAMEMLKKMKGKVEGLAFLELGKIQNELGMKGIALKELQKALKYEASAPEAYYVRGKIFLSSGNIEESQSSLLKVKYLYPQSKWYSPSLIELAMINIEKGDTARAINYLKDVIERREKPWKDKAEEIMSGVKK